MKINDIKCLQLSKVIVRCIFDSEFRNYTHSLVHYSVDKKSFQSILDFVASSYDCQSDSLTKYIVSIIFDDYSDCIILSFLSDNKNSYDIVFDLSSGELKKY